MQFDWGTLSDAGARKPARHREFAVYLLTPGFSNAYHMRVLGLSDVTVSKYAAWAGALARADPSLEADVAANVSSITRDDGLKMAQRRGSTQLVFWSRLALCELLQLTGSTAEIARMFRCSRRTVQYVGAGRGTAYNPLSGRRCMTHSQAMPRGRWLKGVGSRR